MFGRNGSRPSTIVAVPAPWIGKSRNGTPGKGAPSVLVSMIPPIENGTESVTEVGNALEKFGIVKE